MENLNELLDLYKKLIEQIYDNKKFYTEKELCIWPSCVGKEYNNELMIVGRAGNGGEICIDKTESEYSDNLLNEINDNLNRGLQWVIDRWGNKNFGYNTKKSAFWRLSKKLSYKLVDNSDFVFNKIVYSNLYKVSNYSGGNPSSGLIKIQIDICREILMKEIEIYKPKIIVFLTGWSWAKDFLENIKNIMINTTNQYVEFVGHCGDAMIIVSQHPQAKPEKEHCEAIINEFEINK